MKGDKALHDPVVEICQAFYRRIDQLRNQFDDELLDELGAKYIEQTYKEGRNVDEVIAELTVEAVKRQKQRRHSEQWKYFEAAEMVIHRPDVTNVNEACHLLAKHFYIEHHQARGDATTISQEYNFMFDGMYVNQIKEREIRAAKELFGE